jgi:hypothetical protein
MPTHDHANHRREHRGSFLTSRAGLVLIAFLAIGGYFLWAEHRGHVVAFLPWLLLLACPLLHVFMHGGHGRGDNRGGEA